MNTLKLCFIGFGNVGQKVSELLLDKKGWLSETYGREVLVTGIAGRSKGSLVDPDGIDLKEALAQVKANGCFAPGRPDRFDGTPLEMMDAACAVMNRMATFDEAGIDDGYLEPIRAADSFTVREEG